MNELIYKIVTFVAPLIAGIITSVSIPLIIKKITVKYLKKKIDEVNENEQLKEIKTDIKEIKREILEMRGKRK